MNYELSNDTQTDPVLFFANSFFNFSFGTNSRTVDRQEAEVKCKKTFFCSFHLTSYNLAYLLSKKCVIYYLVA